MRITATPTLALPRRRRLRAGTDGELYLGDISVPPWLCARVGARPPRMFGPAGVVRLAR